MMGRREDLFEILSRLIKIKNECSSEIFSECGLSDMTVKQVGYLKAIDEHGNVTFSRLAEITQTSKPTVTEIINRFVRMECAYRDRCSDDGRVVYIRLTDKGQTIAKAEQSALNQVIERMLHTLDESEIDLLITLLKKVR